MKIAVQTLLGLLILVIATTSCGKKSTLQAANNQDTIDSVQQAELFVWVENARIRESADLNAEVVAEIKGGEKLILTGETSKNKSKVKLRGVDFEDVWVKVKTVEGKEGWIFKPMLTDKEEKAIAMNDFLIVPGERFGGIKLRTTQKEVEALFGKEFVSEGEIFSGDGSASKGFYIFKDSPLELACATIEGNVIVSIRTQQPGALWVTAEGVRIGSSIDQLVKLNGKPILFSGFGWAFGGLILGYSKGKLAVYDDLHLQMFLGEPDNIEGLDEFMDDDECSTANKKILGKGVKVAEISIFGAPAI